MPSHRRILSLACLFAATWTTFAALPEGVQIVKVLNYTNCFELSNASTRVTISPQTGGRVLEYSWQGTNALYLDPKEAKWGEPGGPTAPSSAGRLDIGPEYLIPPHPKLWSGPWEGKAVGARKVRLTSLPDEATGVQLIRDFTLDAKSTKLTTVQTIKNISKETKHWAHWSRTFAVHGGIGVVPLTPQSTRYPNHYIMYVQGKEHSVLLRPEDPKIRVRGNFLEVLGPPKNPKLGFDSYAGWFAYVMPHHQAFVKRYDIYPDRVYGEVVGLTLCFWYPESSWVPACELEPHGPRNDIAPGQQVAFKEEWWLLPVPFPKEGEKLDLEKLAIQVEKDAR